MNYKNFKYTKTLIYRYLAIKNPGKCFPVSKSFDQPGLTYATKIYKLLILSLYCKIIILSLFVICLLLRNYALLFYLLPNDDVFFRSNRIYSLLPLWTKNIFRQGRVSFQYYDNQNCKVMEARLGKKIV